jgi:phosphoadenosine phosphosulfate reductase
MNASLKDEYNALSEHISKMSISTAISFLAKKFPDRITFSSSFSYEDQVITHLIRSNPIAIFTLDTGRLFKQTYNTWNETLQAYDLKIKAYYPDHITLEPFIETHGPDSFYRSVENRKQCCYLRKVEPLKRALKGQSIWITGLRAEHSPDRQQTSILEWDEGNQIIKYNPLLHWSSEEVKQYIKANHVPYNALHEKGFVSIGCEPCTRAIREGEDFRAGRWWWEDADKKECGLHIHTNNSTQQ